MNNGNGGINFLQSSIFLDSQPNYALSNRPSYVTPFPIHKLLRPPGYEASLHVNLRRFTLLFLIIAHMETYSSLFSI